LKNQVERREGHYQDDVSLQDVKSLKNLVDEWESSLEVTLGFTLAFLEFLLVLEKSKEEELNVSYKQQKPLLGFEAILK
jgi:hypothetical protein